MVDVDSFCVDGNRNEMSTRGAKRATGSEIAGILHPDGVAAIERHARDEIEGLMRSRHDDHLVGGTAHATQGRDVIDDCFA